MSFTGMEGLLRDTQKVEINSDRWPGSFTKKQMCYEIFGNQLVKLVVNNLSF